MLVCLCHPTSDTDIASHVDEGARTLDDIAVQCGAGTGCGACAGHIEEMLDDLVAEGGCAVAEAPSAAKAPALDCPQRLRSIRSRPNPPKEAA